MKKNVDILQELGRDLPRRGARARGSRGKPHVKAYYGMGLKTYTDALGNEVPLPLSYGIIQRAPKLLRDVAELWRAQGMNVVAQQFTAAHAVIGAVLDSCFVRQQKNLYMLNLQVMIVGGAGSGKSRVALLDRLVEPIDRELRLGYRQRVDDYHRNLQPDVFNRNDANTAGKLCGAQSRSTGRRIVKWMGQGFTRETTDGEYEKTAKGRACGRKKS